MLSSQSWWKWSEPTITSTSGFARVSVSRNAVIFRTEGVRVALVAADGRVALQPVTLGRDYGNSLEVVAGLNGGEQIIVNAPDSIEAGQTVRIAGAAPR